MAASFHALVLIIITLFRSSSSSPSHVLTKGSSLSVENKYHILVSPDGTFTAGFYQVGENAYSFSIWFSGQIDSGSHTVVWMANRDVPVNGRNSKLSLWEDGNLVLTDAGEYIIWSTQTKSSSFVQLQLNNNGNLVLFGNGSQSQPQNQIQPPLWQSFDYPTDTLLPNQPFTKNRELISSRSLTNYSSGFYKFFFDVDSILRLRYDGPETTSVFWPDPGLRTWESGRSQYIYSRNASLDFNGGFSSSDGLRFLSADFGSNPRRIMKVDVDGNVRVYSLVQQKGRFKWEVQWQAVSHSCRVHGICGPNSLCTYSQDSGRKCTCLHGYERVNFEDWSYGCEPEFKLCEEDNNGDQDFMELPFVEFYGYDIRYNKNFTLDACKKDCLQDCTCKGFQFGYDNDEGNYYCYIKTSLYNGYEMGFFNSMYIKLPKRFISSFHQKAIKEFTNFSCSRPVMRPLMRSYVKKSGNKQLRYVLGLGCVMGFIEIVCILLFLYKGSNVSRKMDQNYFPAATMFKRFTYAELKRASSNFSEEIGRGGGGVVYKGTLFDNKIAAIKKLVKNTSQHGHGGGEFQAEMSTIGMLNHMYLIEIWGYCVEGKHRLLVYEYMEKGSLAQNLRLGSLDWERRFKIARGTAKGLAYLHEECLEWVLHCDVKPQNILLDADFNPKVADFGLSKLLQRSEIDCKKSNFSMIRGTRGYMAPEWVLNLEITSKVDVYSYGVVILEMVTGRTPVAAKMEESLIEWVRERVHGNGSSECWVEEIVDSSVSGAYDKGEMENLVKIALQCVEEAMEARPSMSQVVNMLLDPY